MFLAVLFGLLSCAILVSVSPSPSLPTPFPSVLESATPGKYLRCVIIAGNKCGFGIYGLVAEDINLCLALHYL